MSRLPTLSGSGKPSSGPTLTMPPALNTRANLKRKASTIEEESDSEDQEQQPRQKVPAIGTTKPTRPLQPSQSTTNGVKTTSVRPIKAGPKPLTRPRAPAFTRPAPRSRASGVLPTQRGFRKPTNITTRSSTRSTKPLPSSRSRGGANPIDADLDNEKKNLASLRSQQNQLSTQLVESRTLNQRRELVGFSDEIEQLKRKHSKEIDELQEEARRREEEMKSVSEDLLVCRQDLEVERRSTAELREEVGKGASRITEFEARITDIEALNSEMRKRNQELEASLEEMKSHLATKDTKLAELQAEVAEADFIRRKLHNTIQELKGNIRVFCRVRPILPSDAPSTSPEEVAADINYPDPDSETPNMIQLTSSTPAFTGPPRKETHAFSFDRVFPPDSTQAQVFEEIELLVQSSVDGYNVCVFAYGQTGSGKSWTMEGGSAEEQVGMIPRAVEQVFRVAGLMKKRGWEYSIEGEFLEIYNETIHDLLSKDSDYDNTNNKKKREIKHDLKTQRTRVTNITTVPLTSAKQVRTLLALANSRRSVAATLVNERSSRSHSVFTLRISGVHVGIPDDSGVLVGGTGEQCSGCLNLVDLAGSERLNVSFANGSGPGGLPEKERVKETQNINKSLSALGDVISALGEKHEREKTGTGGGNGGHVPYRNSKLTYLLQNSLSGSSKTLMFLNLSPLAAHTNESLNSLRFATKVNNTHIGTAKKQNKTT